MALTVESDHHLVDLFGRIVLFESLDGEGLKALLRLATGFEVPSGNCFFHQGDAPDGLYVVGRGDVEVSMRSDSGVKLVLARLSNNSIFGEMSLIDGGPRSATVQAVSQTTGAFLARDSFEQLRARGAPAADRIVLALARTLDERRRTLEMRIHQILSAPDATSELLRPSTKELIARLRKA